MMLCVVLQISGRWACDTAANYKEACLEELRDRERTPLIDLEQHNPGERDELSCSSIAENDEIEGERRNKWEKAEAGCKSDRNWVSTFLWSKE